MRLTVGPLPPAVYWRRRAVVLAAVLLPVLVLLYSCGGGKPSAVSNTAGTPAASADSVPGPTVSVLTPQTGPPPKSQAPVPTPTSATATAWAGAPPGDSCTDAEISVTPAPSRPSAPQGVTVEIGLEIKNIASRTCRRDLGADLQEVYVKLGAQKVWSSDTCGNAKGSNMQLLSPGVEYEYRVAWNGHDATRCANNAATGPYPAPGDYQVIGRLGTKLSEPVQFTITA